MDDPQATLLKLNQNLNILQERRARYADNAPLDLLNQIEDHQTAIDLTRQAITGELNGTEWRTALKPLLIAIDSRGDEAAVNRVTIDVGGDIVASEFAGGDISIGQKIVNIFTGDSAQRDLRNRQILLNNVHNFWIEGVLENSLHGTVLIELGMEEQPQAVERGWDMVLQTPDQPHQLLPLGTKMIDVFNQMEQALLILGDPGAGKTTMLLELARDTIALAQQDPTQPIPVVFHLSSWAESQQSLDAWLVDELNTK